MKIPAQVAGVLALILIVYAVPADTDGTAEDDWFDDDFEERIAQVNDGELEFLSVPPDAPVHYHRNSLTLDESSLEDGWARLRQCHEHLDAVPRAQIVFRKGRLRNLTITGKRNIARAWVDGASVQLEDVSQGAELCLNAESQVLSHNEDGSYSVRNGPYMRRFLDGYYPMRVTVEVSYPCGRLELAGLSPERQKGFSVTETACGVQLEAWFQGRLTTELRFVEGTSG